MAAPHNKCGKLGREQHSRSPTARVWEGGSPKELGVSHRKDNLIIKGVHQVGCSYCINMSELVPRGL